MTRLIPRLLTRSAALIGLATACIAGTNALADGTALAEGQAFPAPMTKTADVIGTSGEAIGSVTLTQGPQGVVIRVELAPGALTPGWHGMHFHAVGDCSDIGTFKLSGGHVGKVEGGHGLLNIDGPELGDLPNIYAFADGSASAEFYTEAVSLAQGEKALLDADGSALVFHAEPDDMISQPIGGAGARMACAVIR